MWSWRKTALAAVVFIAALGAPGVVSAQSGTLAGTVRDKATKQPIGDVAIMVKGSLNGTQTKANGTYTILGIPPGTYTVEAKRIGYQTVEVTGVVINIDARRVQDFELDAAAANLGTITVQATTTPLVEQGVVGATTTITNEMINALPVTSISEVLALQQGFQELPQNTNVMSLAEEKRNTVASTSTRGSRGGSTVNVVDGIPVNNPLFGTSAINLTTVAAAQTQFSRGYMEPQYGNGLAGIVNTAIREGGERFEGSVDYQTTALAGALGSRPDELEANHIFRGFVAGPVPGTANKLRYALAGEVRSNKARVIKFDDDITRFNQPDRVTTGPGNDGGSPLDLDLTPGWQAFGGTQNQQMVGKLTFLPSGSSKFYVSGVSENRQNLPYNRNYGLTYGGDPWNRVNNLMDSLGINGSNRNYQHVIQASARSSAQLYAAGFEQRFSRSTLQVKVGRQEFERMTCSIWQGVCIEGRYWEGNFTENFKNPFGNPSTSGVPYYGTDLSWGGEKYNSTVARADLIAQATDHHRVQLGASFTRYDIGFHETQGIDGNSGNVTVVEQAYRAKPIDISSYVQDVIEYDFLTINVGIRYDYGLAKGKGFTDPLSATNGTTAREVCEGEVAGIPEFTFGSQRGIIACLSSPPNAGGKPTLLDSATRLAQFDDFKEADARTAFSPRIGISFPLTEQSQMFFNAGRYTKSPAYHDLYRNSGVGTIAGSVAEGGDSFCAANAVKPGTNECHPPVGIFNLPDFIGNPNLLLEQATSYEVGYAAQIGSSGQYAVNVQVYNRDESGLTGTRPNTAVQDVGATYNSNALPSYITTVNQDFSTSRGIEIQFRRTPRTSIWGYDINYGWSRVTENGPPPDRAFEAQENGEVNVGSTRRELISGRDRGHSFNMSLNLAFRQNNLPKFKGASLLKNASASLTYRYSQGQRYTPTRNSSLSGIANGCGNSPCVAASDVFSAFGPAQHQADMRISKNLQLGNAQYGVFLRISNVFNLDNCLQVFQNTGACDTGQRETRQRSEGNGSGNSTTNRDQPEFRSQTRRFNTGITITF
jgi:outer membrane receptor protein involved in Fe transport